jgi:ribosomal protein S18 acetylase RimI-like enzyme
MNIRKATSEDVHAVRELGATVSEFAVNEKTVNFWPEELLAQAMQSDDVLILVAEDVALVGFVIVSYNRGLKKALIENVYVQPNKRGQGISDKLLGRAFELLIEKGCEYIATLVPPDAQSAIGLYTRNGFSKGEQFVWLDRSLSDIFKK